MTKQADLIAYIFEAQQRSEAARMSGLMRQWMDSSPRFTAFVDLYRDKIRKKVRIARDEETMLDLRGELQVASALLQDRRFSVEYEPYASTKKRGPDFSAAYRVNLIFNIEVARIRAESAAVDGPDVARKEGRVLHILLDKLGQMQPGMANLLVIHTQEEVSRGIDLTGLLQQVKTRVEGKDPALFTAGRYASPAGFYKDFLHLAAILLWSAAPQVWINKQARPGLPENVLRLIVSLASDNPPASEQDPA